MTKMLLSRRNPVFVASALIFVVLVVIIVYFRVKFVHINLPVGHDNTQEPVKLRNLYNVSYVSKGKPTLEKWRSIMKVIVGSNRSNMNCEDLYPNFSQESFFSKEYLDHRNHLSTLQDGKGEGSTGDHIQASMLFFDIARPNFVKHICEIGFNAGHSSLSWLSANSISSVLSFDLGRWSYTALAAKHINNTFPGRHKLIIGDSKSTVPLYTASHPGETCDIIFIDGGHDFEEAYADLVNMKPMSHEGTLLIIDDMGNMAGYNKGIWDAWTKEFISTNVDFLFHCSNKKTHSRPGRGLMIGFYIW